MNKTMNYREMCCHHTLDFPSFFDSNSSRSSLHVLCRVLVACSWLMSRENGRVSGGEKKRQRAPAGTSEHKRQAKTFFSRSARATFCVELLWYRDWEFWPGKKGLTLLNPPVAFTSAIHETWMRTYSVLALLSSPFFLPRLFRRASRPRLLMSGFNS